MNNIFFDMGVIIIIATVFAFIARLFRQPLIPAYILTGIIIGPLLGLIADKGIIMSFSEIGIAFLLFIVGLEIDLKKLRSVAAISSLGAIIQIMILFTSALILAIFLGFGNTETVYIGVIAAFSSTMVVIKLLSDKRELDTLHARIIIGILLMEDFFSIIALSLLSSLTLSFIAVTLSLAKIAVLFIAAFFIGKYGLTKLFRFAAKSQELLFLSSLTVCFFFALLSLYVGEILAKILYFLPEDVIIYLKPGLSIVIGAFMAGIALGNLPYNIEIIGKIKSLKDFFSTIFFVSLGMALLPSSIKAVILPLAIFTGFILIFKPILIMFLCSFFGYKKRIAFLTGISLTQISEFSLIIASQGFLLGHISQNIFSLTVLLAVITMALTSYFIGYETRIYNFLSPYLGIFDSLSGKIGDKLEYLPEQKKNDVILCGYNRIGYSIAQTIKSMGKSLLVVDYNPEIVKSLIKSKIPCIYGDIGDLEIIERLDLKNAGMIISTIPDKQDNLLLLKKAREAKSRAMIFVTSSQIEDALMMYDAGADYVIMPHFLGGEHVSLLIQQLKGNVDRIIKTKLNHIEELKKRKEMGHEHPRHEK